MSIHLWLLLVCLQLKDLYLWPLTFLLVYIGPDISPGVWCAESHSDVVLIHCFQVCEKFYKAATGKTLSV